jgi:hypothetical protein
MASVDEYRQIVRKLIREYASYRPSDGQVQTEAPDVRPYTDFAVGDKPSPTAPALQEASR